MAQIKPHKWAMTSLRELKPICLQSGTVSCFRIAKQCKKKKDSQADCLQLQSTKTEAAKVAESIT
jgi:hypothetical protein